jgi:pilin isopeptide linkage protein
MKDAADNYGTVSYGGYDYSSSPAAQIGIANLTNATTLKYRIQINRKLATISNVTVVDTIPDGMTLDTSKGFQVINWKTETAISSSLYSISVSGKKITFTYPGTLNYGIQINYWLKVPAGSNGAKLTNTAAVTYTQDGSSHSEHSSYILQGSANNAVNGEKSVDKSVLSTDPADQYVVYTIKFWNSNGFTVGEINLADNLDPYVKFVSADYNPYYTVTYDAAAHAVKITNTTVITGSQTEYVRFMVDMTNVPIGYTVKNTVGGNTTETTKCGGDLTLAATKTLDRSAPGSKTFTFTLTGEGQNQSVNALANGSITFAKINYGVEDIGKVFTYTVSEVQGSDSSINYDTTVYTVKVTPALDPNNAGLIVATPVITTASGTASAITFKNTTKKADLKITKTFLGDVPSDTDKAKLSFTITGKDVGGTGVNTRTATYANFTKGSYTIQNLPVGETYTVTEANASGISASSILVTAESTAEGQGTIIQSTGATVALVNKYALTSVSVSKVDIANGEELAGAKIQVLNSTGRVVDEWTSTTTAHEIKGLKTGETYTLRETVAPDGYAVTSDTKFTLDATGKIDASKTTTTANSEGVLLVEDAMTSVSISKVDITDGKELAGATIQVLDSAGKVVDEWTSTTTAHEIKGLKTGETYTLRETVAPDGYAVTSNTTFALDAAGKIDTSKTTTTVSTAGVLLVEDWPIVDITVAKSWSDNSDEDGIRPDRVTVTLLANGKTADIENAVVILSNDNNWLSTWTDLATCTEDGKAITYTVSEAATSGYTASITGSMEKGFVIVNTHTPEESETVPKTGYGDY